MQLPMPKSFQSSASTSEAFLPARIKTLLVNGFKKFNNLRVDFNEGMNILVGENEAGKSTILEALKLVFQQTYRNAEKSILFELFNLDQVNNFYKAPCVENLPSIKIEVLLELDDKGTESQWFLGENHDPMLGSGELYGIVFTCEIPHDDVAEVLEEITAGDIPAEFYQLTWKTFAGESYSNHKMPLAFLAIDTSSRDSGNPFGRYARDLFLSCFEEPSTLRMHKHDFRSGFHEMVNGLGLPELPENRKFTINDKRLVLENLLSILDGDILLENKGRGKESMIKMQLAFSAKGVSHIDVATIEEPENHLSYTNLRKMLEQILLANKKMQILIATHSNMIVSRLDLRNVLWIQGDGTACTDLRKVDEDTAKFFTKLDHSNLLDLLLAEKVFLVEGVTEFLLLPMIYRKFTKHSIEADNVTVLSCNGIAYQRYLKIAETRKKRVAVITDNDGKPERIQAAATYNSNHEFTQVFMSGNPDFWTWEKCLYGENPGYFDSKLPLNPNAKYPYHKVEYGPSLGYMLNHKSEVAYQLLLEDADLTIPDYVTRAIQWLNA